MTQEEIGVFEERYQPHHRSNKPPETGDARPLDLVSELHNAHRPKALGYKHDVTGNRSENFYWSNAIQVSFSTAF